MNGEELKAARKAKRWTQHELAARLGVTQAYVSMTESGKREFPYRVARVAADVLHAPATALPLREENPGALGEEERLAGELATLGYPGFSHLRRRARRNPAELLVRALNQSDLDSRVVEGLPWLAAKYADLDWEWAVRKAKPTDRQNRMGFVVALAAELAKKGGKHGAVHRLQEYAGVLERSRLVREDTLCHSSLTKAERNWLRQSRSELARHWNLLTDLRVEQLQAGGL